MARGDHYSVPWGPVRHHFIQLDDDQAVGWTNTKAEAGSGEKAVIAVRPMAEHCGGHVPRFEPAGNFDRETVANRALSRVGETGYDVPTNNCEHLCEWAKNGEHHSWQVWIAERVAERGIGIAARRGAPLLNRALTRAGSPWLLVADSLQLATTLALAKSGADEKTAERVGQGIGLGASVAIGAGLGTAGGPLGMLAGGAIGGGTWLLGEAAGKAGIWLAHFARGKAVPQSAQAVCQ